MKNLDKETKKKYKCHFENRPGLELHRPESQEPMKFAFAVLCFVFSGAPGALFAEPLQFAGIPREKMDFYASEQKNSQWCWAAAIQMVLNYYGVKIGQEEIVARTFGQDAKGNLPDWSANSRYITRNLNATNFDHQGRLYVVKSSIGQGPPPAPVLLNELSRQRPVIVAYATGPQSGHMVVVTGARFETTPHGPLIQTLIVRDPWPSPENIAHRGRIEYPGADLASRIRHYWYIYADSESKSPQLKSTLLEGKDSSLALNGIPSPPRPFLPPCAK